MRRGLLVLMGACLLAVASFALAQKADSTQKADAKQTPPWHVEKISKRDQPRPGREPAKPEAGPSKYLHLELQFAPSLTDRKLHEFRVTDQSGQTVADVYGFQKDQSLLVFEGEL